MELYYLYVDIILSIRYFLIMNDQRKIKAVIFDFDGTLAILNIDFLSLREKIFELIKYYNVEKEKIKERYLLEIIEEVYQILFKRDKIEAEKFYETAHKVLYEFEIKGAKDGALFPNTIETLRYLRNKGIKIGIVTRNCEEAVKKVFPEIEKYCDIFISRDYIHKVKPHPEHLNKVIDVLGVRAGESIMVGDHIIDIVAGKNLGLKTAGVLTGRTKKEELREAEADYILENISNVINLFQD